MRMQFFVEDGKYVLLNRDTMSRFTFDRIQLRALARFILIELNVCDFFIKDRGTVWSGFKRDPEFQAAAKRKWGNEMEIKNILVLNKDDVAELIRKGRIESDENKLAIHLDEDLMDMHWTSRAESVRETMSEQEGG